ncbi:aminopeptidase P family protein [Mesorhizobium soli]|uniref:Aminopeptidase P family protein n=1 Tax=Pseudaminobacter soli (ex Li et al. 2025) TaxID=1295366 RepID=A0A2P7S976_9HYPH|nr:aminopeptidase P family protein [Mesorhizobium soli]
MRSWLDEQGLDGLIVPRTDAHQSEVTAPHDNCLEYISGFTGSAGMALVLRERALIFVDGRYQVQVRQEVDLAQFAVHHLHDDPLDLWLRGNAGSGWRIGIDAMRVAGGIYDALALGCAAGGGELIAITDDPFDAVWTDRPEKPVGRIRAMPVSVAGETSASKRARISEKLRTAGADMLVETLPDNIAWLLNVRGSDVAMNPVPHSFLMLDPDGRVEWFVDRRKLGNDLADFELADVELAEPEHFLDRVAQASTSRTVQIDPDFTPFAVRNGIDVSGGRLAARTSPITLAKAAKNAAELAGYRACHVEDGIALTNFLAWLDSEWRVRRARNLPLTELEAEEMLIAFRTERPGFLEPSFRAISATGANAAMCHYNARPETNTAIGAESPYLIDSGGQYANGTTDATRTVMFGTANAEMRDAYTAVLKGFLSLSMARFPTGTQGHQLDAFARRALWDIGLDYDHGTGHSVGHNLLIHEYPHRFGKKPNLHGLEPGNVMTIEPGYYEAGGYGIRIENQVEVVAHGPGFCRFSSLTLAPIDLEMARLEELSPDEITFLDAYHAEVCAVLMDHVQPETRPYLLAHTRPVAERVV